MSQNPSFIRTDKAIMQAFIELLKEKSFEKITVQDILDKTPVTRATFYAHYHDKYEIAERMQKHFLDTSDQIRQELREKTPAQYQQFIRKAFSANRELTEALLKIHTEKVDIRQAIADNFESHYMAETSHAASPVEARIYGQIRAELELSGLYDETIISSFENNNELLLSLTLKLLRLSDDEEVWRFLRKKLDQKFNTRSTQ